MAHASEKHDIVIYLATVMHVLIFYSFPTDPSELYQARTLIYSHKFVLLYPR